MNIVPSIKNSPNENYEIHVGNDNEPILNFFILKIILKSKLSKSSKKEDKTFTFNYVSYEETKNSGNYTEN